MENLTPDQQLAIRDYFDDPNYPQPHGEVVATQLLSAMIASGRYELEEYPRLAEAAVKLTTILAVRFHTEVKREVTTNPKLPAAEKEKDSMSSNCDSNSADYDPIPF
ncbi:hypothetical protein QUB47_19075 [Microcoleus sp. AT9_B5]